MLKINKMLNFLICLGYDAYLTYIGLNMKKYWKSILFFLSITIAFFIGYCHESAVKPIDIPEIKDDISTQVHIINSTINNHIHNKRYYKISKEIINVANKYPEISVPFLMAVIFRESSFNKDKVSPVGAMGLGQIMPETMWWICHEMQIKCTENTAFNYKQNIQMTAWFLNWIYHNIDICNKDMKLVLAFYNSGGKNAYRYYLYLKKNDGELLDSVQLYNANNVYEETVNYVDSVMVYDSLYRELLTLNKGGK